MQLTNEIYPASALSSTSSTSNPYQRTSHLLPDNPTQWTHPLPTSRALKSVPRTSKQLLYDLRPQVTQAQLPPTAPYFRHHPPHELDHLAASPLHMQHRPPYAPANACPPYRPFTSSALPQPFPPHLSPTRTQKRDTTTPSPFDAPPSKPSKNNPHSCSPRCPAKMASRK